MRLMTLMRRDRRKQRRLLFGPLVLDFAHRSPVKSLFAFRSVPGSAVLACLSQKRRLQAGSGIAGARVNPSGARACCPGMTRVAARRPAWRAAARRLGGGRGGHGGSAGMRQERRQHRADAIRWRRRDGYLCRPRFLFGQFPAQMAGQLELLVAGTAHK